MSGENPTPIQGDLFSQFDAEAAAAAERVVERPERKVVPPANPYATQELMASIREEEDTARLAEAMSGTSPAEASESQPDGISTDAPASSLRGPALARKALLSTTPQPDLYAPPTSRPPRRPPGFSNPAA